MAKTKGHDSRTHLPKQITITISSEDGTDCRYYVYALSPSEITDEDDWKRCGTAYSGIYEAVERAADLAKSVIADLEKDERADCEDTHDLSEIRERQTRKDKSITR